MKLPQRVQNDKTRAIADALEVIEMLGACEPFVHERRGPSSSQGMDMQVGIPQVQHHVQVAMAASHSRFAAQGCHDGMQTLPDDPQ